MKKYTKKQIVSAINYWKRILNESSNYIESTLRTNIAGDGYAFEKFCSFTPADDKYDAEFTFKKVKRILLYAKPTLGSTSFDYICLGNNMPISTKDNPIINYSFDDFSADEILLSGNAEIKISAYISHLLSAIFGRYEKTVFSVINDINDGSYFGRINGKNVNDLTDAADFDKVFAQMCNSLDMHVDVEKNQLEFDFDEIVSVRIYFADI